MTTPHRIIRIHKAISDITHADVVQAIAIQNHNLKQLWVTDEVEAELRRHWQFVRLHTFSRNFHQAAS